MNDDFQQMLDDEENVDKTEDLSGDHSVGGSAPSVSSDDDVMQGLADVIGNEPIPGKPFSLADEIEKDEMERRGIDPEDMGIDD